MRHSREHIEAGIDAAVFAVHVNESGAENDVKVPAGRSGLAVDPLAGIKGGAMGGAGGESADHGDAVRRDSGEVHALEYVQSSFRTAGPGEAGDESGPGDDAFEGHIVEQLEGEVGVGE